ncbi:hypothetical protein DOY81_011053 [Sarcophaga bullata]|nr:hypothetical protein DOY81_011053 [Sarcophaga bullata]
MLNRFVLRDCENGFCKAPNYCECKEGFNKTLPHKCEPICDNNCPHGRCIAPNVCECLEGYQMEESSHNCIDGKCEPELSIFLQAYMSHKVVLMADVLSLIFANA